MAPPARRRLTFAATASVFANFMAYLGLTPLYPAVAHDLGVGADGFGAYFVIQGLTSISLAVPVGVLADRFGRRPVLTLGLAFMATGQLLRWQARSGYVFGLGQVFIGLCGPFVVGASYALVADAHPVGRAQALGVLQAAVNLGQAAGFVLAGSLFPLIGWRGYSLCVAALPVLLLPLAATLPDSRSGHRASSMGQGMAAALRFLLVPAAGALAVVAALNLGTASGSSYLLPFVASEHGETAAGTGLLLVPFLAGSTAGGPLAGRWADRGGLRIPALAAVALAIGALLGFGLLGFSVARVVVFYALLGAATTAILALTAAAVIELAVRRNEGTGSALGGLRLGQGFGPAFAPALCGFIYVRGGATPAFLALAAGMAAVGFLLFRATPAPAPRAEAARP